MKTNTFFLIAAAVAALGIAACEREDRSSEHDGSAALIK